MSIRENIQVYHALDVEEYLKILKKDYGAREHPEQANSYLVGQPELPFYGPQRAEDYAFILGFNMAPRSEVLLRALIDHPELAPDETMVRWTQDQDLVLESTLGQLRERAEAP